MHRSSLDDLASLRHGAAAADGVVHLAFVHDFSQYQAAAATDQRATEAMGSVLAGTDPPLVVASGLAGLAEGRRPFWLDGPLRRPRPGRRQRPHAAAARLVPSHPGLLADLEQGHYFNK